MNLILTSAMFLPISSFETEEFENLLDKFLDFKGFLNDKQVRLYKELSLEDEMMEQLESVSSVIVKKQLEYKTRLIFQRPKPIDIEDISNTNDWDLIFDYLDTEILVEQTNGCTGLDIRNVENFTNHTIRFVYDTNTWYAWRVYFWKQKNIISTISQVLPNNDLTNLFAVDFEKMDEVEKIKKEEDRLDFYSKILYKRMGTLPDGEKIKLAFQIAEDNGYLHDTGLSNYNSQFKKRSGKQGRISIIKQSTRREIFRNLDNSIYLSLDFENFQFEVQNSKGEHQGVWNFTGKNTAKADATGNHDIIIS